MPKMLFADGLHRIAGYGRTSVPIFLTNDHRVIEAPSRWIMDVAKTRSRSQETLRQYAYILGRFLRWLDEAGYMAQSWALVDEDIFDEYIEWMCTDRTADESSRPKEHETLKAYCARIYSFYAWAGKKGYRHYFELDMDEIESKVKFRIKNQFLLEHITPSVTGTKLNFNLPTGRPALYKKEIDKFVTDQDLAAALHLLDDEVYKFIAVIIRITGLRPKDLFQIPYQGKGVNEGFIPYDYDDTPEDLDERKITYFFNSKGKKRGISFPGKLWRVLCESYIPLRRERAELYYKRHGRSPRNDQLFLTANGTVVTYQMLYHHFGKVVNSSRELPHNAKHKYSAKKFTPRMLRHSCATYFVHSYLVAHDLLGKPYVHNPVMDDELRKLLGHEDIGITYKYYVHLANMFAHDDLLLDLQRSQVDSGLNALLAALQY